MKAMKSQAERSREQIKRFFRCDKPQGPRITKWTAELAETRKKLLQMTPKSDGFAETAKRLIKLASRLGVFHDVWDDVARRMKPDVYAKAAELERLSECGKLYLSITPTFCGFDSGYCMVSGGNYLAFRNVTAETLPAVVGEWLRKEAEQLTAMADRIERAERKTSKRRVA